MLGQHSAHNATQARWVDQPSARRVGVLRRVAWLCLGDPMVLASSPRASSLSAGTTEWDYPDLFRQRPEGPNDPIKNVVQELVSSQQALRASCDVGLTVDAGPVEVVTSFTGELP